MNAEPAPYILLSPQAKDCHWQVTIQLPSQAISISQRTLPDQGPEDVLYYTIEDLRAAVNSNTLIALIRGEILSHLERIRLSQSHSQFEDNFQELITYLTERLNLFRFVRQNRQAIGSIIRHYQKESYTIQENIVHFGKRRKLSA